MAGPSCRKCWGINTLIRIHVCFRCCIERLHIVNRIRGARMCSRKEWEREKENERKRRIIMKNMNCDSPHIWYVVYTRACVCVCVYNAVQFIFTPFLCFLMAMCPAGELDFQNYELNWVCCAWSTYNTRSRIEWERMDFSFQETIVCARVCVYFVKSFSLNTSQRHFVAFCFFGR